MYQGTSCVQLGNKTIICDKISGNLYELDKDTYQNNGQVIQRQRITSSINGKLVNKPGKRLQMSRLEFIMEKGVGLMTGQGEDPKIMIDVSYDGGRSWKAKGFARIGRLGESTLKVELFSLDSFYDMMIRITTSDPVPYSIYTAALDIREAGW